MSDTTTPEARANAMTKGRCRACKRRLTSKWADLGIGPVCARKAGVAFTPARASPQEAHLQCRANYAVIRQQEWPEKIVWINDVGHDKGCPSVTNDAHAVVASVLARYPQHRIVYRDSMGNWDELAHDGQRFTEFRARGPRP